MPLLRVNASSTGLVLQGSPAHAAGALRSSAAGSGPIIIMVHGYKYDPDTVQFCPHHSIFAHANRPLLRPATRWPQHLGFGLGHAEEGLAVAFGWRARGALWQAMKSAQSAGMQLAQVIEILHSTAPHRPIHVVTHSMGSEVFFAALPLLPKGSVARALTLTAASYQSRAAAALDTMAGRSLELFNVISRENDLFDALFEGLIGAPQIGDRAAGCGLLAPGAVNIEIDCPQTLRLLRQFGGHIGAPQRRICHWSAYTRPGVMKFYKRVLRQPERVPLAALQQTLPQIPSRRWARLWHMPSLSAQSELVTP